MIDGPRPRIFTKMRRAAFALTTAALAIALGTSTRAADNLVLSRCQLVAGAGQERVLGLAGHGGSRVAGLVGHAWTDRASA